MQNIHAANVYLNDKFILKYNFHSSVPGALLGTKLYVKFDGKAPYDSSMQQLLSQIKVMLEDK